MKQRNRPWSYRFRRLLQRYVSVYRTSFVGRTYCPFCDALVYEFSMHCPACGADLLGEVWDKRVDAVMARYNQLNSLQQVVFEGLCYMEEAVQPRPPAEEPRGNNRRIEA